jgi:hypothetical protein
MRTRTATLLLIAACVAACASPTRPPGAGRVFDRSQETVHKATEHALAVNGFEIKKSDPFYVEGFRTRSVGLFVGSGGETVGVWIEPVGPQRTRVQVDTAKSIVGIVGQKNWDEEVLAMLERELARQR